MPRADASRPSVHANLPSANIVPFLPRLNKPFDSSRPLPYDVKIASGTNIPAPSSFVNVRERKQLNATLFYEFFEADGVMHRMTSLFWSKCAPYSAEETYPFGKIVPNAEGASVLWVLQCVLLWMERCLTVRDAGERLRTLKHAKRGS